MNHVTQGNDGWVRSQLAAGEAARAKEAAARLAREKHAIGIPVKFRELADGPGLQPTQALSEVRRGGFEILVLAGDVGRGKTVAAAWWLIEAAAARRRPLFVSAARLSRWERYDPAEMDRLLLASRLVIDDLGEEFNDTKGNFLAVLDETIADRVANRRPTVITTNLTAVDMFGAKPEDGGRYGIRIRDRIRESGRWQSFAGPSMRGQAA